MEVLTFHKLLIFQILIFCSFVKYVEPGNILVLLPIASKSHKNIFDPLISALSKKGHNITVVTPLKSKNIPPNVRELTPLDFNEINPYITSGDPFQNRKAGKIDFFLNWNSTFLEVLCDKLFEHQDIKNMLKYEKGVYDVIILNMYLNPCTTGMAYVLQAPHMYLVTMPAMNAHVQKTGLYFPPSFVPNPWAPFSDEMNFKERVLNFVTEYFLMIMTRLTWNEKYSKTYQRHLGEDVPTIREIDRNVSMIMMNSHFSLTYPRPLLPDVVEVGGMHTKPAKPLPKDLDDWLSAAKDGFIYFSLGSIVQAKNMPIEIKNKFLNVFSRLKQRVLWKWEGEMPDNLPKNVKISKWLPQQDILGHPNIRIFMTHGGLLSTQEGAYHGVPMIGFPLFADQDMNMIQAEKAGFAVKLEIIEFTEVELESAIKKILDDDRMSNRAKQLSTIFKDQPFHPVDLAVYHVEYIMRHKGAPHLRSAARNLDFVTYHSLDVISFLLALIFGVVWIIKLVVFGILRLLIRFLRRQMSTWSNLHDKKVK